MDNFIKNVKKDSNRVDNESKSAVALNFYGNHLPVVPCVFVLQVVTSRGIVLLWLNLLFVDWAIETGEAEGASDTFQSLYRSAV